MPTMNTTPTPAAPRADQACAETAPLPFPPRNILVPLDFSPHSFKALRYAEALARQFGSRLHLLHVTEPIAYPTDLGYAPVISGELETELQRGVRQRLDALLAEVKARGFAVEGSLRVGRPFAEIVEAAAADKVDLVVVTTHGFTGLKLVLLGSTAERVVRHSPCPVLVVRDQEHEFVKTTAGDETPRADQEAAAPLALKRVLVPLDFSAPSRQALAYASRLAGQFQAALLLVHVMELPYLDPSVTEIDTRAIEDATRQTAQEQLAKVQALSRAAGLPVTSELLTGSPWNEVADYARREAADLIVAGTHGYTGLKHALLGSTAERIVRHAPCPVLVVREAPAA